MQLGDRAKDKAEDCASDIEYPSKADLVYETSLAEALYPKCEGETTPSTDKVLGVFPKEDGEATADDTRDGRRQQKHATHDLRRRVDRIENPKLEDEDDRRESEGVKPDEEETRPSVFVSPKGSRQTCQDKQTTEYAKRRIHASVEMDRWDGRGTRGRGRGGRGGGGWGEGVRDPNHGRHAR